MNNANRFLFYFHKMLHNVRTNISTFSSRCCFCGILSFLPCRFCLRIHRSHTITLLHLLFAVQSNFVKINHNHQSTVWIYFSLNRIVSQIRIICWIFFVFSMSSNENFLHEMTEWTILASFHGKTNSHTERSPERILIEIDDGQTARTRTFASAEYMENILCLRDSAQIIVFLISSWLIGIGAIILSELKTRKNRAECGRKKKLFNDGWSVY